MLQGLVDDDNYQYPAPDLWAYIKNFGQFHVYPDHITAAEILTYTYYDNYDPLPGFNYDPTQFDNETSVLPELEQPVLSTVTRGLVTGSKVKISRIPKTRQRINGSIRSTIMIIKAGCYRPNPRTGLKGLISLPIFIISRACSGKNILRHQNPDAQQIPGAIDSAITTFKLVKTSTRNIRDYGGSDQVVKLEQKINGGPLYNISQYHYDHLNRAVLKNYSSSMVLNEYNMRGF